MKYFVDVQIENKTKIKNVPFILDLPKLIKKEKNLFGFVEKGVNEIYNNCSTKKVLLILNRGIYPYNSDNTNNDLDLIEVLISIIIFKTNSILNKKNIVLDEEDFIYFKSIEKIGKLN